MPKLRPALPPLKTLSAALATCFAVGAQALPTAPTVTHGSASFQQNGNALTVTNSNGAIINWNSFSVAAGESTRFIQPSASSSVLNRVLGVDPSSIYGSLSSNGRIYLVNPNGIFVGAGGRVDAAAFVGSTLALSDQDFLAGRLNFTATGTRGAVQNEGVISTPDGGSVYLVGSQVTNSGNISAPDGEVILAAGQTVQLVNTATPGVTVEFSASDQSAQNLGAIAAGRIGLAAALVRNAGTLNAGSVSREGGRIFLRASKEVAVDAAGRILAGGTRGGSVQLKSDQQTLLSGNIDASGSLAEGGAVEILGDRVGVFDGASVNASGQSGGGSILVGGDVQGSNPAVRNAQTTWLGRGARLSADAGETGNGGKIIVWADDTTRAAGQISARGGVQGGDGGFAEVSGKRFLDFQSPVDLGANQGTAGTLLLDPQDVTIVFSGPPPNTPAFYGDAEWFEPADTAASTTLSWTTVSTAPGISDLLNAGTNVVITTAGAYGGPPGGGTITLAYGGGSPFAWTSTASLKLLAHNDILIQEGVIGSAGTLELVAAWDGASLTTPVVQSGGTGVISENPDGYVVASVLKASAGGSVTLANAQNQVATLKAFSDSGSITYFSGARTGLNDIYLQSLIAANGSITVDSSGSFGGNITLGDLVGSTAPGGLVSVGAIRSIFEDDVGVRDILAYGASLSSVGGSGSPIALAISADIDAVSSINAVTNGTGFGGIRINHTGAATVPDSVSLADNNAPGTAGPSVSYTTQANLAAGSLTLTSSYGGGDIVLNTAGSIDNTNMSLAIGGNIRDLAINTGQNFKLVSTNVNAQRNLSVAAGGAIDFSLGGSVSAINGTASVSALQVDLGSNSQISGAGGVTLNAQSMTMTGANSGLISTGGEIRVRGGSLSLDSNASIGALAGVSVDLSGNASLANGAQIVAGATLPPSDVKLSLGGSLLMSSGSRISASNDVLIRLLGSESTLGLQSNALVISRNGFSCAADCTWVDFVGRADGGVLIDGLASTTTVPGNAGFYVTSVATPAVLGSTLKVSYASRGVDPVATELGGIFDSHTRDDHNANERESEDSESADQSADSKPEGKRHGSRKTKAAQCS